MSCDCLCSVALSLAKPWVGLQCVSMVFPCLLPEISKNRMSYQNREVSSKHPPVLLLLYRHVILCCEEGERSSSDKAYIFPS